MHPTLSMVERAEKGNGRKVVTIRFAQYHQDYCIFPLVWLVLLLSRSFIKRGGESTDKILPKEDVDVM